MTDDPRIAALTAALTAVVDPELGIDVVALGLVYGVTLDGDRARVQLTMTAPGCPMSESIVAEAEAQLRAVPGIADAEVLLVWDPPWTPARMTASAKELLGWAG